MISAIIVWGSLLAAVLFAVAYLLSPSLRAQVEQPKFQFQQQLQDFDKHAAPTLDPNRGQK